MNTRRMRGFTLIEVLIAVLIVAVGLLGMAALQINSIQSNTEGFSRAQALAISDMMVGRIKANRWDEDASGLYSDINRSYILGLYNSSGAKMTATTPSLLCTGANVCNAVQMAAYDKYQVVTLLNGDSSTGLTPVLPGGEIRTTQSSDRLTIYVFWEALAARSGDGQQAIAFNTRCSSLSGAPAGKDCVVVDLVP